MAMVTLNATSDANLRDTVSFKNRSNRRDASFSSYLNGDEETFVRQLEESSPNFKSHISNSTERLYLVSKKAEDKEIDVFNAEKYFNGVDDEGPRIACNSSPEFHQNKTLIELYPAKQQSRTGNPSIHSESSSNSRSALLHNIPRNHHPQKKNKVNRKSFLGIFGCNCSCIDKNSVDIDDHIGQTSSKRSGGRGLLHSKARNHMKTGDLVSANDSHSNPWVKEDVQCREFNDHGLVVSTEGNFTFQAPDSKVGNNVLEVQQKQEEDDTRRKSVEVFGSPVHRRGKKLLSLERSLNMLPWDAIVPRVADFEISANSSRIYYDTDSDASSDLFEIQSFSTNPSQYLTRQASDGMSSCITQTTCYAPSEASIEWSVVTASAADFSVASEYNEVRTSATKPEPRDMDLNVKNTAGREIPKRRKNILSGCNSQKAVRVVGDAYKTSEKASPGRHQRSEFLTPMRRFHAVNELARFENRNGHFS